jgi:hypothetical protein
MKAVKSALIGAGVAALIAVVSASPAAADQLVNFTWNPSGVPAPGNTSQEFTADGFQVRDFANINLSGGLTGVQENAILVINSFTLVGSSAILPTGYGSAYQLYFMVTATSNLAPASTGLFGSFTNFSYSLVEDVGGQATFSAAATSVTDPTGVAVNANGDAQITVATGSLVGPSTVGVLDTNTTPGHIPAPGDAVAPVAGADADITSADPNFFVAPSDLTLIDFEAMFTNTGNSTTPVCVPPLTSCPLNLGDLSANQIAELVIGAAGTPAGGGNLDLVAVPEPLTLSLFGAGLLGAGVARRRKSKKA